MTEKVNELVPDRKARMEVGGVSAMTFYRWDHKPGMGFPPPVRINGRNYRSRLALDEFKNRLISELLRKSR
jgi:predicted DNA-binding transcriptional regulator AlpA